MTSAETNKGDVLFIVMPAYNESENISETLRQWYEVLESIDSSDSRLVVLDDGSKDDTFAIMSAFADGHPLFVPLTHENAGHGATVYELYQYALAHDADFVFQTDTDGQTVPEEMISFWADRSQYDMIIGWRSNREDGISRIVVTRVLRAVVRIVFGVYVKDANTPFRLMSADSLRECLRHVPEKFNLSNVILSVVYVRSGRKVDFRPITFKPRQGGVNSINIPRIVGIGRQAVKDFWAIRKSLNATFGKPRKA